jgi:hypothetical protein
MDALHFLHGDVGGGKGSNIKSIQKGKLNQTLASTSVTISSIDVNKSLLFFDYSHSHPNEYINEKYEAGQISNSTSINFSRQRDGYDQGIGWSVFEFEEVKSKQSGGVVLSGGATTDAITINSVNVANSVLVISYKCSTSSLINYYPPYQMAYGTVTSPTSIEIYTHGSSTSYKYIVAYWQLLEFK